MILVEEYLFSKVIYYSEEDCVALCCSVVMEELRDIEASKKK